MTLVLCDGVRFDGHRHLGTARALAVDRPAFLANHGAWVDRGYAGVLAVIARAACQARRNP